MTKHRQQAAFSVWQHQIRAEQARRNLKELYNAQFCRVGAVDGLFLDWHLKFELSWIMPLQKAYSRNKFYELVIYDFHGYILNCHNHFHLQLFLRIFYKIYNHFHKFLTCMYVFLL